MNKVYFSLLTILVFFICWKPQKQKLSIEQWDLFEIVLKGPSTGNPYMEVELSAIFKNSKESIKVPGFYDGEGVYRIRFSPGTKGNWSYQTISSTKALSGKKGNFICVAPSKDNHGPVGVVNTFYFKYADSSTFFPVGTTAYQWTSVKQSLQNKTLETLANAPFNKIRMCVFPKSYIYGNKTEPWIYPFRRDGQKNDFTQPAFAFFKNFDSKVEQLRNRGIQADVILFHPYDVWGYSKMGKEMNERYVRYMIARLSAYRNVWWSLANEWDVPEIKDSIDWQGIGTLLQKEDPHQRLRGIHNWYDSEDHFYDHSKPWITHVSAQTAQFYNGIKWLQQYKKPLLYDEMRYEGDVPSGWGNLTGKQMASYFWMAALSGGYGTHGETFKNGADDTTEVRWWAKGGNLVGESMERIRFFRSVMQHVPIIKMTPSINDNGNPKKLENNIYILSCPGEYYLAYVADTGETIELNLPGTSSYNLHIIDTWNMKIVQQKTVAPGMFKYKTLEPYTAIRMYPK